MSNKAFEQIVEFLPAFDKRSDDPKKNYGIHGVELRMVLKGDAGAVQFLLYTNWQLPHVSEELKGNTLFDRPLPADLGYHSKTPMYEGQECRNDCQYLDGHDCYYDGSSLDADRIFKVLCAEGSDGVWRALEAYYNDVFGEK